MFSYAKDAESKLYSCFLDIKKAFDTVWQDGLFYKLSDMGVGNSSLSAVISLYDETESCVLFKGYRSESFRVTGGTRQGGISSPYFYLCFINELLCTLENSQHGLVLSKLHLPCTTSADDMVLRSLSKRGLDRLKDICYSYSTTWLFDYNPEKCDVIVFNESKREFKSSTRK